MTLGLAQKHHHSQSLGVALPVTRQGAVPAPGRDGQNLLGAGEASGAPSTSSRPKLGSFPPWWWLMVNPHSSTGSFLYAAVVVLWHRVK